MIAAVRIPAQRLVHSAGSVAVSVTGHRPDGTTQTQTLWLPKSAIRMERSHAVLSAMVFATQLRRAERKLAAAGCTTREPLTADEDAPVYLEIQITAK